MLKGRKFTKLTEQYFLHRCKYHPAHEWAKSHHDIKLLATKKIPAKANRKGQLVNQTWKQSGRVGRNEYAVPLYLDTIDRFLLGPPGIVFGFELPFRVIRISGVDRDIVPTFCQRRTHVRRDCGDADAIRFVHHGNDEQL